MDKFNLEDHEIVVVVSGPAKFKVFIDGKEIRGVTAVSLTADVEHFPELVISKTSVGGNN